MSAPSLPSIAIATIVWMMFESLSERWYLFLSFCQKFASLCLKYLDVFHKPLPFSLQPAPHYNCLFYWQLLSSAPHPFWEAFASTSPMCSQSGLLHSQCRESVAVSWLLCDSDSKDLLFLFSLPLNHGVVPINLSTSLPLQIPSSTSLYLENKPSTKKNFIFWLSSTNFKMTHLENLFL